MTYNLHQLKLDGVGPVDTRPSTDTLHNFVQKRRRKGKKTWHLTHDMSHVTCDMWQVICDMWNVVGGEHCLIISAPYLLRFVIYAILKILTKKMTESMNESVTRVFVEQSRPHRVCNDTKYKFCHKTWYKEI